MIDAESRSRRAEIILYAVGAVILLAFSWYHGLVNSEDRWAEIAREMMISGDWLHPAINGQIYNDKPFLSYWLIVWASYLFAGVSEFTLRLPSIVAGVLALFGTVQLGKMMFNARTGITAGWLLAGCYGFLFMGRSGEADIQNMAAIILAVAWLYRCREKAGFLHYLLFYAICFLGAMTKGLPSVAVPLLAALVILIPGGLWKRHLKVTNFLAFVLVLGLYLTPFLLADTTRAAGWYSDPEHGLSSLELLWRENITRSVNAFDHDDDPWYVYTYALQRLIAPWCLLFFVALVCYARDYRRLERPARMTFWFVAAIFIFFTIPESRRWYYMLPNVPFCMLFIAWFLNADRKARWERWAIELMRYVIIVVASLMILSPGVFLVLESRLELKLPWLLYIGVPFTGILALGLALVNESPVKREKLSRLLNLPVESAALLAGETLLVGGVFACVIPSLDTYRTTEPFIKETLTEITAGMPDDQIILLMGEARGPLIYYMNRQRPMTLVRAHLDDQIEDVETKRLQEKEDFRQLLRKYQGKRLVIISDTRIIRKLGEYLPDTGGMFRWEEPDYIEDTFKLEKKGKRKLAAWVLDPVPAFAEGDAENGD